MPHTARPSLAIDLIAEPAEVYHAKADRYLSSHALADFRACPLLYRKKQLGLIPARDTTAYLVGRAAHVLILEGRERFEAEFTVGGGPVNPRTGQPFKPDSQAYKAWAARIDKGVLSDDQAATVEQMAGSVAQHDEAQRLLRDGVAEGVVRIEHLGMPCQVRLDWLSYEPALVDLKTARDLDAFTQNARDFRYVHQLAFYRSVLWEACGLLLPVWLIAVEKQEPYRTGVWEVSPEALAMAQDQNEQAMRQLKRCRQRDHWPTGYETPRVLDEL